MTLYLKETDVIPEVERCRSVLLVVCRFCPATSLAIRNDRPYLEPFRRFLDTGVYEEYVADLRAQLADRGVGTEICRGDLLNFIICMWTPRQRARLRELAAGHDAAVVLGCDVARETVTEILDGTGCRVVAGMECEGVLDATPRFDLPGTVSLTMIRVTPLGGGGDGRETGRDADDAK